MTKHVHIICRRKEGIIMTLIPFILVLIDHIHYVSTFQSPLRLIPRHHYQHDRFSLLTQRTTLCRAPPFSRHHVRDKASYCRHKENHPSSVSALYGRRRGSEPPQKPKILDAEFERVVVENKLENKGKDTAGGVGEQQQEGGRPNDKNKKQTYENELEQFIAESRRSLLDMSLESYDSEMNMNATRIPFFAPNQEDYIDTKLAFVVDIDGTTYGIGIPYEHAAAVVIEKPSSSPSSTSTGKNEPGSSSSSIGGSGSIDYLAPDNDENEEIFEIMATQLKEHVGDDLKLKRTPRILTIAGPLEKYTKGWQDELVPKAVDKSVLFDESDEDLKTFHEFMKSELGTEEYEKTMNGDDDTENDDLSPELLNLFNIPGLGDQRDDVEGMKEIFESTLQSKQQQIQSMKPFITDNDGVALKLISYIFPDSGKSYSLVNLIQPYALVARCVREKIETIDEDSKAGSHPESDTDVRFELLRPEEEKILIPKLEKACVQDLEQAGLKLTPLP